MIYITLVTVYIILSLQMVNSKYNYHRLRGLRMLTCQPPSNMLDPELEVSHLSKISTSEYEPGTKMVVSQASRSYGMGNLMS